MNSTSQRDPWVELRSHTPARIALGSSGNSLPTDELLRFGVAHAQARDAVHLRLDADALRSDVTAHGFETIEVESAAADRSVYLRRPDLGRQLSDRSRAMLDSLDRPDCDLLCMVGDGLSAKAVHRHAVGLLLELRPRLESAGIRCARVVLAHQARVALGDAVAESLHSRAVLVLIGERPGLSSPDSMGAYLTWAPRPGRADSERNCVSNIRREGLPLAEAARKLAWLIVAARRLNASGVTLKDESDDAGLCDSPKTQLEAMPPGQGASS